MTDFVKIVEVGPRDGLQNEEKFLDVQTKFEFIKRLVDCGFTNIEAGAFVSPKWIPQMADTQELFLLLKEIENVNFSALVPNIVGLTKAQNCGVKEIAVFVSASESFSQKNTNCSIEESLLRVEKITKQAKELKIRGYISCVFGCPYEGKIKYDKVLKLIDYLFKSGCYEISIGDTIGVATAGQVANFLDLVKQNFSMKNLAGHFHDTYGQALANIAIALTKGMRIFDSSVGGLGGCPYAKGASGNVVTEDLVYMLYNDGYACAINFEKLISTSAWICNEISKPIISKSMVASFSKRNHKYTILQGE